MAVHWMIINDNIENSVGRDKYISIYIRLMLVQGMVVHYSTWPPVVECS